MRKILREYFTLLCLLMILLASCTQKADKGMNIEAEKKLIEQTIRNSIAWAKNKDLSLFYGSIANDTNYLAVHPEGDVVRGIEEVRKQEKFWMSPDFKAVRYEMKDMKITLSGSGDVAWWYCLLDDINEWKGRPANWVNTRMTGVLEKREGKWVIVQMHFSFACEQSAT
jgi:ketosteroid isomerase-like protein